MELIQQEYDLLHRMTAESGEMWRECRDRTQDNSEVVICTVPTRAFYLRFAGNVEGNINGWIAEIRPLGMDDAREFFAAFGSHYYYWIGVIFRENQPLRAYIKNGRKPAWTIGIGASE